jgi:hypothetical protein
MAALLLVPETARGTIEGDEAVFQYRAYPNMLIVLDRSSDMAVSDNVSVGDVDGNGAQNRYDLALKIVFRLLNADGNRLDNTLDNTTTPPNASSVDAYRSLITVDDELYLSQRIGVLYYDNTVHLPSGPPFQVYAPDRPPNAAPYLNASSESWMYTSIWDNVYALGPPATGGTVKFPWSAIPSYFGTCTTNGTGGTTDANSSCRPKVVVMIINPSTQANMDRKPSYIDNSYNLFALVVGDPTAKEQKNLYTDMSGVPDNRIEFFSSAAEVENSGIFQDMVAQLQASTFEFVAPVVPAVRTTDNNRLYIATFTPATGSGTTRAIWPGHLYSFNLNLDGSIPSTVVINWDAATRLPSPSTRNIYTTDKTSRLEFSTSTSALTSTMLGVAPSVRDNVITTVRSLPLGDIFHSTPVIVGAPSRYYADVTGIDARVGFVDRYAHRKRVIVAGANDGMLHAFNAGNWNPSATPQGYDAGTGREEWAYIPGFLLANLKNFTTLSTHNYYVDSAPAVADIWVDTTPDPPQAEKLPTEWHTVVIGGAGKGGKGYYALDVTNPEDLNYPAFRWELTNDPGHADRKYIGQTWSTPAIGKIRKVISSPGNNYTVDQWVAIVGGGMGVPTGNGTLTPTAVNLNLSGWPQTIASIAVNSTGNAPASGSITITLASNINKKATGSYTSKTLTSFDNVLFQDPGGGSRVNYPVGSLVSWGGGVEGNAIFILDPWNPLVDIDNPSRGPIIQRLGHSLMGNVVAPPTILTDSSGYITRVYVGDLNGNMWRATFDNTFTWTLGGAPFFTIGGTTSGTTYSKNIYTKAAVSSGMGGYWIGFGTGDRENPMNVSPDSNGAVFMVTDNVLFQRTTTTKTESDLQSETAFLSEVFNNNSTITFATWGTTGWYGVLGGGSATRGEKMLSAPAIFNSNIYFTTFSPETSACQVGGTARVYGFGVLSGVSALYSATMETSASPTPDVRVRTFSSAGIPSSPVISVGTGGVATLYFGTTGSTVKSLKIPSPAAFKRLKYWREVR